MSIFDWSTTASSNGSADANINFSEGQAPSTLNDSARAVMARLAFWRDWSGSNMTQGGASNAYTITSGESLSAYVAGMRFCWRPNAASTGAVTLNLDGIGAKKVYLPDGTQAASGDLDANSMYDVVYDASLDTAAGGWQIVGFPDANLTDGPYLTVANNLSDLNSASTARTNLGLGTSATVNTGTSGATVPLLNGANTHSGQNIFRIDGTGDSQQLILQNRSGTGSPESGLVFITGSFDLADNRYAEIASAGGGSPYFSFRLSNGGAPTELMKLTSAGVLTVNGNTVWHAGNDGAGSGLDADTLDGVQGSAFGQLAATQSWSGANTFTSAIARTESVSASGTSYGLTMQNTGGTDGAIMRIAGKQYLGTDQTTIDFVQNSGSNFVSYMKFSVNPGGGLTEVGRLTATGANFRVDQSSETSGTLTSASANKSIVMTGNITINGSVFTAGDMVILWAGGAGRTITQGTGMTLYLDGTTTTGTRTLAVRGMAVLFFPTSGTCVVSGGAVT